jgi:phosphatidylglycerol:prolipoprotein diacylglycerol transferase
MRVGAWTRGQLTAMGSWLMHLPYFSLPPLDLSFAGLGKLDWFAIFVFSGVVVGVLIYDRIVKRGGDIDERAARIVPEAVIVGGFIGAHLVHVLAYHPELMKSDPWALLEVWAGMSSVGGFLGGALAAAAFLKLRGEPLMPYADRLAVGLSAGWVFGRLGCAAAHDHPGVHTQFWLGVAYPDGVRHDLGLYELLLTLFVLLPVILWLSRRPFRTGTLAGVWLVLYGAMRLPLDFLRADDLAFVDTRYFGVTPAQYVALFMVIGGLGVLWTARQRAWRLQPALWGSRPQQVDRPRVSKVV